MFEAYELRDGDSFRFGGKGVRKAVEHVNGGNCRRGSGEKRHEQMQIDSILKRRIPMKTNQNRRQCHAGRIFGQCQSGGLSGGFALFRYLGGCHAHTLPVPMMNILNGGAHAKNNIDIQEFMIMPTGADSFPEALRWGCEIFHALGRSWHPGPFYLGGR